MKVVPVPVRSDNYAYLLIDEKTKKAAAVDVYDVPKVQAAAKSEGVDIIAALTTHHHHDHSGGNAAFAAEYPDVPIYGGSTRSPNVTHVVKDKDEFTIADGIQVKCLATPCHTQDSICYYVTSTDAAHPHPGGVFTGDTLFIAGCGRFFEGTAPEMNAALSYLGTLPDQTVTYPGHEYTASNVRHAKTIDPENDALKRLEGLAAQNEITAGLTTIGEEKQWNTFMRVETEAVRKGTGAEPQHGANDVMDTLRELKNNFRG